MNEHYRQECAAFRAKGEHLLRGGSYEAAARLAHEWRQRFPGEAAAGILLCRALLGAGDFGAARRALSDLEVSLAGLEDVYGAMGAACLQRGAADEARCYERKRCGLAADEPAGEQAVLPPGADAGCGRTAAAAEGDDAYHDIRELAQDFHTLTLVELYIMQGHLDMASQVLREIVRRDGDNTRAAELLRVVEAKRARGRTKTKAAAVMGELQRWLGNIERMRCHAG